MWTVKGGPNWITNKKPHSLQNKVMSEPLISMLIPKQGCTSDLR